MINSMQVHYTIPRGHHTVWWGRYEFEGPIPLVLAPIQIRGRSGIYLISGPVGTGVEVIDIGESGDVGNRLASHDRKGCWIAAARGDMSAYLHETPPESAFLRYLREQELRALYPPRCGKE
ncbi:MAG: hypothetical protein M3P51_02700 [Chloroflexota bacterium]|nr:hypothetical protein [Chloroflexota bacterium]